MTRRSAIATVVVAAWLAGLGMLTRRETFRGETERLAQAGLLVAPGAQYFSVSRDSEQIGWASSTIDTSATRIHISELFLTEEADGDAARRLAVRGIVNLTRSMRLTDFRFDVGESYGPYSAIGVVSGDTLLTLVVSDGPARADTTRHRLAGPLLLPTTAPLTMVLARHPAVGRQQSFTLYDPVTGTVAPAEVHIRAESLFVITDSASLDPISNRWTPASEDTVRAWRIEQIGGGIVNGWVDEKGRLVKATVLGEYRLHRSAYEIAIQNWNLDTKEHPRPVLPAPGGTTATPPHD